MYARFVCADVNEFLKIRRNLANGSAEGAGRDRDRDIATPKHLRKGGGIFRGAIQELEKEDSEWDRRSDYIAIWSVGVEH
jgi:hypothetical protein